MLVPLTIYYTDDTTTTRVRSTVDLSTVTWVYSHPNPVEPDTPCFTVIAGGEEVMALGSYTKFVALWEKFKKGDNSLLIQFSKN